MKQRTLQKKSKEANIQLLILNIIAVSRTVVREKIGVLSALHTRVSPDTNLPFSFNVPYNHYFDNKACIFYAAWSAFCISNVSLKHAVSPLTRALSVVQSFFWDAFSSCVFSPDIWTFETRNSQNIYSHRKPHSRLLFFALLKWIYFLKWHISI